MNNRIFYIPYDGLPRKRKRSAMLNKKMMVLSKALVEITHINLVFS